MKKTLSLKRVTLARLDSSGMNKMFGGYENESNAACSEASCEPGMTGCQHNPGTGSGGSNGPITSIWWTKNRPPTTVDVC